MVPDRVCGAGGREKTSAVTARVSLQNERVSESPHVKTTCAEDGARDDDTCLLTTALV